MKPREHTGAPGDAAPGWNFAVDSTAPAAPPRPAASATATVIERPKLPPVHIGAQINNYVVEQLIGEGGMGAVWRVRQRMLKVPRAMKVLKPGFASVERFEEEMELLAMVSSDNVVQIIDSGELADGSLFYVMELVEGRTLEAEIAKHKGQRPQWEYVREIILQICDGLAAIHDRGIIHRDMKPANCMLSPGVKEDVHVKIVDLGVARRSSVLRPGSTSDGMFIGSAAYASPEQAAGETTTLTYGSDVYSVGIMLYELLTGIVPHIADGALDRAAMLRRRVLGTLPPPPTLRVRSGTIPPEIDEVLVHALQPDPRDRFQSIAEFAEALRRTPDLPRQLRRTRPSQSLPPVPVDALLASDSSPALATPTPRPSGPEPHPSQSASALRTPPPSASSAALKTLPPSQSGSGLHPLPSQSSPGLAPVSAPALDISTLIAARPGRRPSRLAVAVGLALLAASSLALPGVRARLFGAADEAAADARAEPAAFTAARAAIRRLGLAETHAAEEALQRLAADPAQPPDVAAAARLLEAELALTRALACQISLAIDPSGETAEPARAHVAADPARASALLRGLPQAPNPRALARVLALRELVRGLPPDAPDLDPADRAELEALAGASALWRDGHAVPAELLPPLQRVQNPSTLVRSVLALGLWRAGHDAQAHRLLTGVLKAAADQPAAHAIIEALLRSHDGDEPPHVPPPVPQDDPPPDEPPQPPPTTPPGGPPLTRATPVRLPEKFASLDHQVDVGCQRVARGDRSGVRVLMDALQQGVEFEQDFDLCFCLGEGFSRQKAHDVALQWYRRALAIAPTHREALAGAARTAALLERIDRAVELYHRLLEVDPTNGAAQSYLSRHDPAPLPSPEEVGPLLSKPAPAKP